MTRPEPVTPGVARAKALARYDRHAVTWATGADDAPQAAFDLPLHPPNEARALADLPSAVRWADQWRGVDGVVWGGRRWPSAGDQSVPERLVLSSAADLAGFAGQDRHWATLSTRVDGMVGRWGEATRPVLRRHARSLVEHDEVDIARLVSAVSWLAEHPGSGLYLRQLPIEGLSTKWIEARRTLVTDLVGAVTGRDGLGLAEAAGLVRVRALDDRLVATGPRHLAAPAADLDAWELAPDLVVVVENLQTFLALPRLRGCMAVHGAGYAADLIGGIGWARRAPVVYWGDLDRDGFAILDRLRAHCDDVTSILMDEATLLTHRHLWTPDPTRDANAVLPRLSGEEQHTLDLLRTFGGVRLEQERLAWPSCVEALEAAAAAPAG